jgi:outer membrane protein assembly factor BamB
MNSWATPSCATDGQRVVAFFGVGGLHCFDLDGNKMWSSELGEFAGGWGVGGSPVIHNNLVIQNCDAEGDSFVVAINKESGKEIWRTPRRSKPRGGWSTPIVVNVEGRDQIVLNGEFGIQAYDPTDGHETWFCKSFNGRGTPTPVAGLGKLFVVSGKSGAVYAVKPGGKGDITKTHMAWHTDRKGGRDLPSPILVENSLFVMNMAGIATSYDATTGAEKWKTRLGGKHSSSPVSAGNVIYACAEDGTVYVVRAGGELELIATNSVGTKNGEIFRSSMAISNGQLFLRSDKRLICVGKRAH